MPKEEPSKEGESNIPIILTVDGGQREVGREREMGISSNIVIYICENVTVRPIIY